MGLPHPVVSFFYCVWAIILGLKIHDLWNCSYFLHAIAVSYVILYWTVMEILVHQDRSWLQYFMDQTERSYLNFKIEKYKINCQFCNTSNDASDITHCVSNQSLNQYCENELLHIMDCNDGSPICPTLPKMSFASHQITSVSKNLLRTKVENEYCRNSWTGNLFQIILS